MKPQMTTQMTVNVLILVDNSYDKHCIDIIYLYSRFVNHLLHNGIEDRELNKRPIEVHLLRS
jgi:hypothetical protein